jgi:hypothetical protein
LSLITNINFNFLSYDKLFNFKEAFFFNWYRVDQYVYWTLNFFTQILNKVFNLKMIIIVNWWVLIILIIGL